MSEYTNYDEKEFADIFDREIRVVGADVIAGLLHVHCGKQLQDLHVLDAGCGTGRYSKALTDLGVGKLSVLDASPAMLKVAVKKLRAAIEKNGVDKVIEAVLPNLPFEDGTFDGVIYNFVLQDLEKPGNQNGFTIIEKVLHNTKRILRNKGVLVITTALLTSIKESLWFTQLHQPVTNKLASIFPSTGEWFGLFTKCGFKCVSAMNFLFPDKVDHFDPEGPLREDWWLATFMDPSANEQEKTALNETIAKLKEQGELKSFMDEHDRTLEMGYSTLLCAFLSSVYTHEDAVCYSNTIGQLATFVYTSVHAYI